MSEKWYAVMEDRNCDDWGWGSKDLNQAYKMVIEIIDKHPDAYIAVIENDCCVDEIGIGNFDTVYYYAAQIAKAHDWDEARDDFEHLMHWLDMEDEWKSTDADNFEDVLRKAGKKIGVDLV